jgi:hypothetical protein
MAWTIGRVWRVAVTLVIIAAEALAVIAVALGVVAAVAALVESQDKERRQ